MTSLSCVGPASGGCALLGISKKTRDNSTHVKREALADMACIRFMKPVTSRRVAEHCLLIACWRLEQARCAWMFGTSQPQLVLTSCSCCCCCCCCCRNSKLTHRLQDALGGNSRLLVLACISTDTAQLPGDNFCVIGCRVCGFPGGGGDVTPELYSGQFGGTCRLCRHCGARSDTRLLVLACSSSSSESQRWVEGCCSLGQAVRCSG
jgi:hypothetical protein